MKAFVKSLAAILAVRIMAANSCRLYSCTPTLAAGFTVVHPQQLPAVQLYARNSCRLYSCTPAFVDNMKDR